MALAMDGAEVKELVAERVPFLVLGKEVLERDSKLAQTRRFGPGILSSSSIGSEKRPVRPRAHSSRQASS